MTQQVKKDLHTKMVLLSGPRQVGKTTLAKSLAPLKNSTYFNWDITRDREAILKYEIPNSQLLIFDEIHKNKKWRDFLKGLYDDRGKEQQILVTGSARLDMFHRAGDSLQGRYYLLHLMPLSVQELKITKQDDLLSLYHLSGFPEPFFSSSQKKTARWSMQYRSLLIHDEIDNIDKISDISKLELLLIRLPELVASPLSINSLREDLQVSHATCARWLMICEKLCAIFRIPPFGSPLIRAVKKEAKHYHYDWNLVKEEGRRFENFFAVHLLKYVHFCRDTEGRDIELRYFRDTDLREVDFVLCEDKKPISFMECKLNDSDLSKHLCYLRDKFPDTACYQVHLNGTKDYISKNNIRVLPALKFLQSLC